MGEFKETSAKVECWYIQCPYCKDTFGINPHWADTGKDERFNEKGNFECPECGKISRYKGIEV